MTDKIAYTYAQAAEATGVGETRIKEAVRNGELTVRYPSSKPIIEHDELLAWVHALPTERKAS